VRLGGGGIHPFRCTAPAAVTEAIALVLSPERILVIGRTEKLSSKDATWFTPAFPRDNIHRRLSISPKA
jgi:hypothetical protein